MVIHIQYNIYISYLKLHSVLNHIQQSFLSHLSQSTPIPADLNISPHPFLLSLFPCTHFYEQLNPGYEQPSYKIRPWTTMPNFELWRPKKEFEVYIHPTNPSTYLL